MPDSRPGRATTTLKRGLTLVPAASLVVTTVIGTGVFLKARVMTCNVGSPWLVLLAYAVAGVFTLAGALTFAELGTLMPRAGGEYNYIGAGFGRRWAFLYGWTDSIAGGAASNGAKAVVFVIFFNDLLGGRLSVGQAKLMTVGTLVAVTALVLAPIRNNGHVATFVTTLKVLLVVGIGAAAFVFGDGSWARFGASGAAGVCEGVPESARFGVAGFGAAIVGALWSYDGWSVAGRVAEEMREPGKTLPRALVGSAVLLIGIYLFVNAGYFFVLDATAVASVPESSSVAGEVLVRLLGAGGAALMAAGLMVSTLGSLHASLVSMSRIPFAMARDGLLPRTIATVSPRTHVPTHSAIALGVIAIVFALTGTFDILTDMVVFVALVFSGLGVASVYVLRRRLPDAPRPYRVLGYPVVPALFLGATVYLCVNTFVATPGRALLGLGLVVLGLPVYAYYARSLPRDRPEDWLVRGGD